MQVTDQSSWVNLILGTSAGKVLFIRAILWKGYYKIQLGRIASMNQQDNGVCGVPEVTAVNPDVLSMTIIEFLLPK